jgi:hypothetical protein
LKKVDSVSTLYEMEGPLGDDFRYANVGFEEMVGDLVVAGVDVEPLLASTEPFELRVSKSRAETDIRELIALYENLIAEYGG